MRRYVRPPLRGAMLTIGSLVATAVAFTLMGPGISFGSAVAAAVCWCVWLERRPGA